MSEAERPVYPANVAASIQAEADRQVRVLEAARELPVASLPPSLIEEPIDDSPRAAENGSNPLASPDGARIPRVKRKERWITLEDDAYENFQMRVWVNFPQRLETDLTSRDEERVKHALTSIVLEHNGWLDEDGNPYPPASSGDFWQGDKSIPNELLQAIITLIHLEAGKLPNSLIEKSRSTKNT